MTNNKRGGKREGAGRKPIYDKPLKSITLKLPQHLIDWLNVNTENKNAWIIQAIEEKKAGVFVLEKKEKGSL